MNIDVADIIHFQITGWIWILGKGYFRYIFRFQLVLLKVCLKT